MSAIQPVAAASAIGVALLAATSVWQLARSSYTADVRTICEAEDRSGHAMAEGLSTVTAWIRARLTTSDGNLFYSSLADAEVTHRAERLRREAMALGIERCPMVSAYERLAADAEYRADVEHLCSRVTFPDFADLDDEARLSSMEAWIEGAAKSPRAGELARRLRDAPAAERADVLRAAARQSQLLSCDLAKVFSVPRPE
jgi:hypothetical protein